MNQKTNYAAPALRANNRREGVITRRSPHYIHNRHNSKMHWYSNRKLAETTSHRLHKETTPRKRTGNNIPARSRLQKRSSKSHKSVISANTQYQGTLCYNKADNNENAPNDNLPSQTTEEDTHATTKIHISHYDFPAALNSIKEYITERDGDTYIPLHSTIVLKNRRRMLYLPLKFGELTMDGLVDSGAFINAMS